MRDTIYADAIVPPAVLTLMKPPIVCPTLASYAAVCTLNSFTSPCGGT